MCAANNTSITITITITTDCELVDGVSEAAVLMSKVRALDFAVGAKGLADLSWEAICDYHNLPVLMWRGRRVADRGWRYETGDAMAGRRWQLDVRQRDRVEEM